MEIENIEINTIWEDNLKKDKWDVFGTKVIGKERRFIIIIDKTKNSISYKDSEGYLSWITFSDFSRIETSINKERFSKI